ncbi:MAG: ABC transporter permease [Actinomycetota bacterium]|nr:ABC transporter permease [Actinomycetota bacterium]
MFLLISLNFFLPRTMPGDPISGLLARGSVDYVSDDALRDSLADYYGLDRPLPAQYVSYLGGLVRGDLGVSIGYNVPVSRLLAERLPWTVLLISTSMTLAVGAGVLAGVHSGWRRGRAMDRGLLAFFLGVPNFPVFFVGSLALIIFAVKLDLVPLAGAVTPFTDFGPLRRALDIIHHLVMPASLMALEFVSLQYLTMRAGMVSELGSDYLLLGRAKGLSERRLKYAYAARNALLPALTVIGVQLSYAVAAAIFIERIFAYPGVGLLLFEAAGVRDYPALQGCFLVITIMVVGANFVVDTLYARLDPRTVQ